MKEQTSTTTTKEPKNKKSGMVSTGDTGEREVKLIESESESPKAVCKTQKEYAQHKGVETESEVSANTPEYPDHLPCEYVVPQNVSVNGVQLPNPNTVFWIPYLTQQKSVAGHTSPCFIVSQPSPSDK